MGIFWSGNASFETVLDLILSPDWTHFWVKNRVIFESRLGLNFESRLESFLSPGWDSILSPDWSHFWVGVGTHFWVQIGVIFESILYIMFQNEYFCDFSDPQEHCMLELIILLFRSTSRWYTATMLHYIFLYTYIIILSYLPIFMYLIFYSL